MTGAIGHSVVTGLEIARDRQPSYAVTDAFSNGRPPVTDLFRPNPDDTYAPALVKTGASSEARSMSTAAVRVRHGEAWRSSAARSRRTVGSHQRRLHARSRRRAPRRTSGAPTTRSAAAQASSTSQSRAAPLYAAYSTSFNPSYDGSFGLTLAATGVNAAALPPERSRNLEAGAKWDLRSNLFATAALFRTEKTNAKTTDVTRRNCARGRSAGEGRRARRLRQSDVAMGDLQRPVADGRDGRGVRRRSRSRQAALVRAEDLVQSLDDLSTAHPISRWAAGAQFTDGYFFNNTNALTTANAAAIQRLTKYWLFNAVGIYEVNGRLSLQVNAMNLANERYVDRGYTGHFIPGAGRAVLLSPVFSF